MLFWSLIIASGGLILYIVYTLIQRHRGESEPINWETMGVSRFADLQIARNRKLNQKQREKLIWEALGSGDLDMMIRALDIPGFTPERHFILSSIVSVTYGMRDEDSEMRALCETIAGKHIREFPRLARSLRASRRANGQTPELPHVSTFQYLATLLTEKGEYHKAIEICELAISYGLNDGTKSGFQGRIQRIRQMRDRMNAHEHAV
ncbi:MAG: hypothetical protein ACE5EQ_12595 [Phycisphaerae bacterium]